MKRFWKRDDGLERELRTGRPKPRDEFVRSLAKRVEHVDRPRLGWRLGLAGALTAALLLAVASVGGFAQSRHAIGHVVGLYQTSGSGDQLDPNDPDDFDPGNDQYKEQRKACKKTEQARHQQAQQQEEQTHKANLDAIKNLPKGQQQAARDAEEARHRNAVKAEADLHHQNMETCKQIGKKPKH